MNAAVTRRLRSVVDFDPEHVFANALAPTVVEELHVPARAGVRTRVPDAFAHGGAGRILAGLISPEETVWQHQALALQGVADGHHVLITTGTGSGKSLAFQLPVLKELLEGDGTAIVLYPQKALGADQLARWRDQLRHCRLPAGLVAGLNGDTPMSEREAIIRRSRVILATPDIIHAWLMRTVSATEIQEFLARLRFLVLDEAHALDGVFGSNCAYLLRRLRLAVALARGGRANDLQIIAASATMHDPEAHLERLTGCRFMHVGEAENGAPTHGLTLLHIEGPDRGTPAETALAEMIGQLQPAMQNEGFVVFVDARQGVERITKRVADDTVLPYRSGYEADDRRNIETALKNGGLSGCVSTSALELGIDIARFRVGLNLGVPATRKALRQRVGRVGRTASGVFAVVAPRAAFARLGTSLEEYFMGPVEPGHLYLQNQIIQFEQACCLLEELGHDAERATKAIGELNWPSGFEQALMLAMPGTPRPPEIERIAGLSLGNPHLDYSLRQIADTTFTLRHFRDRARELGEIAMDKAIREAYPGATYLHLRRPYRVIEWRATSYDHSILVEPIANGPPTVPILLSRVAMSEDPREVLEGNCLAGDRGSLVEASLRVTETVLGYTIGSRSLLYSELSAKDRRLRPKLRQIESTGVIMRIAEPWFAGTTPSQLNARKNVAMALRAVLLSTFGILPGEIGVAHTGISLFADGKPLRLDDAIAVYDDLQGGLRLSTALFSELPTLLDRLRFATTKAGEDSLLDQAMIERLDDWYQSLEPTSLDARSSRSQQIYAAGSVVGAHINGEFLARRIVGHEVMSVGGQDLLMYRYEVEGGGTAWVSHDAVRPIGDDLSLTDVMGIGGADGR